MGKKNRLTKREKDVIMQHLGEDAAGFVLVVQYRLDEIRRSDGGRGFQLYVNGDHSVEVHQDEEFILLRTKRDVKKLIKELEEVLEDIES